MRNIVAITIDEKGDLHVDFSGYVDGSCQFEEAELRRVLAEMGIKADIKNIQPKMQGITQHEETQTLKLKKIKI